MTTIDPSAPLIPWTPDEARAVVRRQIARNHQDFVPSRAKLTAAQVTEIRETYYRGTIRVVDLAERYGVGQRAVYHILNRETWRDVA